MARSRPSHRSCNCNSYPSHRTSNTTLRSPGRRPQSQRDRQFNNLVENDLAIQAHFGPYQLQPHFSATEGPLSPGSVLSDGSYDNVGSVASSCVTGTTADLERQRHTSPFVATPTNSEASFVFPHRPYYGVEEGYPRPGFPIHNHTGPGQGHELHNLNHFDHDPNTLAGINHIPSRDAAARFVQSEVEFVSARGPSPTRLQRYPQIYEPWTGLALRQEDAMLLDDPEIQYSPTSEDVLSPTSSTDRVGRRNGPLSAQQRKNANAVRQIGACLRCCFMKETCDDNTLCNRCRDKKGRKWKLGCIRLRLEQYFDLVFPAPLKKRYAQDNVNRYIENHGWFYLQRPEFTLKLEMGLVARPLEVTVKEIEMIHPNQTDLHAFQPAGGTTGSQFEDAQLWSPPVVLYLRDQFEGCQRIRAQLRAWMRTVFEAKDDHYRWPWPCFEVPDVQDWEGEIMEKIYKYHRPKLASHSLLGKALSLPFFGYLLNHTFMVTGDALEDLLRHLRDPRPIESLEGVTVSPETINRFIKMLIFPLAIEIARDVLKNLHDMLLAMATSKVTTTAQSDLAFCLAFIILVFLGQSQSAVLMLSSLSETEPNIDLSLDKAREIIDDIETKLASYVIHLHEFAIKRRKSTGSTDQVTEAVDQHAAEFQLMGEIRELCSKYSAYAPLAKRPNAEPSLVATRPGTFDVGVPDIKSFDAHNVHRLCWKFVEAIMV